VKVKNSGDPLFFEKILEKIILVILPIIANTLVNHEPAGSSNLPRHHFAGTGRSVCIPDGKNPQILHP
jgi:hypothetical protein